MHEQLKAVLSNHRKQKRELQELREARQRLSQTKNPDPKILKMIDDEIHNRTNGNLT